MPKIIIGLTGQIASGKGVSKKYLEKEYGASSHRFSTVMRDILKRLYLPLERNNLQNLSLSIRKAFGGDIFAKVIAQDVSSDSNNIVVIDGVRRFDDITSLKNLTGFYLIAIKANPEIRYQRVISRNENAGDNQKTWEQFLEEEKGEAEMEIPKVMATAKFHLDNNGTLDELYLQIDQIIKSLSL